MQQHICSDIKKILKVKHEDNVDKYNLLTDLCTIMSKRPTQTCESESEAEERLGITSNL